MKRALQVIWAILRARTFLKCPFCKGAGGSVVGYYEPEWTECYECYSEWDNLADMGMEWFQGRVSLLNYLRSRIAIACGLWSREKIKHSVGCKLGRHLWMDESEIEDGLEVCCVCYSHRKRSRLLGLELVEKAE